jgi:hypothetical protein
MSVGLAVEQSTQPCCRQPPLLKNKKHCHLLLQLLCWHCLLVLRQQLQVSLVLWQCCHQRLALQVTQIVLRHGREQQRLLGASAGA